MKSSVKTPIEEKKGPSGVLQDADASSIVDQAIKQMEETKKIQDLEKQIEHQKKEQAKAQAKKQAILDLIKPK